jgi:hypothetical protein
MEILMVDFKVVANLVLWMGWAIVYFRSKSQMHPAQVKPEF